MTAFQKAEALERSREEVFAEVEGWRRSSRQGVLDLGGTRPDFCMADRTESGHVVRPARAPVDRAFA